MSLRITSLADAGEPQKERLVMRASSDVEVGKYAVFCCWIADDGDPLSGDLPAAYWFEDFSVKSGDLVVLYTKVGKRSEKVSDSGRTSHFCYWNKTGSIWTKDKQPVLTFASPWHRVPKAG